MKTTHPITIDLVLPPYYLLVEPVENKDLSASQLIVTYEGVDLNDTSKFIRKRFQLDNISSQIEPQRIVEQIVERVMRMEARHVPAGDIVYVHGQPTNSVIKLLKQLSSNVRNLCKGAFSLS